MSTRRTRVSPRIAASGPANATHFLTNSSVELCEKDSPQVLAFDPGTLPVAPIDGRAVNYVRATSRPHSLPRAFTGFVERLQELIGHDFEYS
jgi:hypothetical protein